MVFGNNAASDISKLSKIEWYLENSEIFYEPVLLPNTMCRSCYYLLPPQGFGPDGQNPRRHPRGPRVLGRKISQYEKKISIFQERGSQGIAEKFARDCRNFVGGRRNTRRSLGAESLHEILKWKGKSCN